MGMFDSLMAGAQVNPQLAASLQAMPADQHQEMLRRLGIAPDSPAAQVTGNWTDSLSQPPPMPGVPRRPSSPIPAGPGTPPLPTATQGMPMPSSSAGGGSTPPPMPSSAAAAAMPTGPASRNPQVTPGQAGPPMPARNPMLTDVTGGTVPPFLGGAQGAMGQAPSGVPVPASSPLAIAGPQSAALATGGNAGPMLAGLPGAAPAFMQPAPGVTPLGAPGAIPAELRAALMDQQTGRMQTPLAFINQFAGINPAIGFNGAVPPWLQGAADNYNQLAAMGGGVYNQLQGHLLGAENAATNRAIGSADVALRGAEQLGMPGVPGRIQTNASEAANRNAVIQDNLSHEAQRQRWLSTVVQQHIQATGTPPTQEELQQYEQTSRSVFPGAAVVPHAPGSVPAMAPPGVTPPSGATPPPPPGQGSPARGMLDRVWTQVVRQHGTPSSMAGGHGPSASRIDLNNPTVANRAITDFVARALTQPGVGVGDLHQYLGDKFGPNAVTSWMQQRRGNLVGVDNHTQETMDNYFDALRRAGVEIGSADPWYVRMLQYRPF